MTLEKLSLPTYRRGDITPGIAHIGVGNFHRSHQAMYLNQLMNRGLAQDWGIVGIGLLPGDVRMRDALAEQDYRYTLVEKYSDGATKAQTIGSIVGYLFAPDDPDSALHLLTSPQIRIVSLTITEGGYNIDRATGEFLLDTPAIAADIQHPESPTTAFGYITAALKRRRETGIPPFTVMSCDNLPGNGHIAKHAVTAFARAVDPDLANWIEEAVAFPNSMVDRITPMTTDADRTFVTETYGIVDAWPVMCEPFTQWVLEDRFTIGRPPYENAGVQIVPDVVPYELMKLRLLNATHQAMAYIGMLLGYTYVHEAVADIRIERFLRDYLEEARVTLPPVPGVDLDAYIEELFVRYRNPYIADTLTRLAVDASDRIPKFVLPSVRDNLAAGRDVTWGAAVVATWAEYLRVSDPETIVDAMLDELLRYVFAGDFLGCEAVFGELGHNEQFVATYESALALVASDPSSIFRQG
ncbi:MAG: mannitol dehydrogenase family protein [Thermomicrobiales bacterium]|nr:mannitol dehydrogenase family protein [Thermomicrobiales bacterium]